MASFQSVTMTTPPSAQSHLSYAKSADVSSRQPPESQKCKVVPPLCFTAGVLQSLLNVTQIKSFTTAINLLPGKAKNKYVCRGVFSDDLAPTS